MRKTYYASSHTPEYLLHKYWARKPYNVLREVVEDLMPSGGTVVDPFCGSGVLLREAGLLGNRVFGFDINPIAILISETTCYPIDTDKFIKVVDKILSRVENKLGESYKDTNGNNIRYNVHEIVVKCKNCGEEVSPSTALKVSRIFNCPTCKSRVNFNLKTLDRTRIVEIALHGKSSVKNEGEIIRQEALSQEVFLVDIDQYNFEFIENKRILSHKNMKTSDLFTLRNFSIICAVASEIDKIEDNDIKRAGKLLLTATMAQCSRLIAYRQGMTTGGPAWSVPGFWVPPLHLETNPLVHLRARLTKFKKGLEKIESRQLPIKPDISRTTAVDGLEDLAKRSVKANLIFLDPPYGDSVPYAEFSAMWNSILGDPLSAIAGDISVSDRDDKEVSWQKYEDSLSAISESAAKVLQHDGKLLITFNNHDLRAWSALISALQRSNFKCVNVFYQIPAVVSAKAQFSPDSSYISDIYSVYVVDNDMVASTNLDLVISNLVKAARMRGGVLTKSLLYRILMTGWIKENLHHSLFERVEEEVVRVFDKRSEFYHLRDRSENSDLSLRHHIIDIADSVLKNGPCSVTELYEHISAAMEDVGVPEIGECVHYISGDYKVLDSGRIVALTSMNSLFD